MFFFNLARLILTDTFSPLYLNFNEAFPRQAAAYHPIGLIIQIEIAIAIEIETI